MDELFEAVEVIERVGDWAGAEITSVELDDRAVVPGALFCCIPGHHLDGHDFARGAVSAGASALLVERRLALDVPQAVVGRAGARPAMAEVSSTFYGRPARSLTMAGVTGTNGKTTVTRLLGSILEAAGKRAAVIGTLDGARTTPEAPELHRLLAAARDGGQRAVALEVSSHALAEHRVDGIVFDVAVFTNLSQDHLDYHHTMDDYFAAKAKLFTADHSKLGVINADDEWGQRLLAQAGIETRLFSMDEVTDVVSDTSGSSFTWRGTRLHTRLRGRFHVANAVAAAATAEALGVEGAAVASGLERAAAVPGRFEVVEEPAPFTAVVDYAHTPDGLRVALESTRALAGSRRVICVFGCGGDRDREKRPLMGAAALAGADLVVLTSDNPRSEDPMGIIAEVLAGMTEGRDRVVVEPDRGAAIALAVDEAGPGDVVLVAGKGHETTIEAAGVLVPFDDRTELAAAMRSRAVGASGE